MKTDSAMNNDLTESLFVRVGGLLGFLIVALAFVVNFVLIRPPAEGAAALVQPKAYISDQAGRMAIANGLRNLIFFCVPFWAAALFTFTRRSATLASNPWGMVGLLGAVAVMAMGTIANGIQTVIFLNYGGVSEQRDVFLALWAVTHVLFSAAPVGTAAMVTGFSLAGWRSGALPTWLVALGFIFAAATIISCVGIVSAMTGGWAAKVMSMFIPLSLVWLLSTSVLMVRRPSA
jgi:hypothetical protein